MADVPEGAGSQRPIDLLPGEPENARVLEDAEMWASVYDELVQEMEQLASGDADGTDAGALRAHLRRIEARRAFWRRRRALLARTP